MGIQGLALAFQHLHRVVADVRLCAAKRGQQQRPKRINIRPCIGIARQLFGGGIGVFASKFIANNGFGTGIGVLGNAKVDDHRLIGFAIAQDDVVGRQVAVHDVAAMRDAQPFGNTGGHGQQIGRRQAARPQQRIQVRPLHIIHHQIDMAIRRAVVFGIAHHGIMTDFANFLFAAHQGQIALIAGKFGFQRLDRHKPPADFVAGLIHFGRAAPAQHGFDAVGVVQQVARLEDIARFGFGHRVNFRIWLTGDLKFDPAVGVGIGIGGIKRKRLAHA